MRIAVYCASSIGNDSIYENAARDLGRWMAGKGYELVFGASDAGLMGAIADEILKNGGRVIGVTPDVPEIKARVHDKLSEYVYTDTIAERRTKMIELADAYIAMPGGIGTLDEISEVICLAQLHIHEKPSVFYNIKGYYEPVRALFNNMNKEGFGHGGDYGKLLFSENIAEIEEFLNQNMA